MLNAVNVFCSKRRWIKRLIGHHLDEIAWVGVHDKLTCFFDPRDLKGPSHHVAFQPFRGFYNYERQERDEIVEALPEGGVFVDIGANIGLFTLFVAEKRSDVKIIAYEPERIAFQCLSKSIEANRFSQVSVNKQGIADKTGAAKLYRSSENAGGHSIDNNSPEKNEDNVESVELTTLSLDHVDVIKLDVEGFEAFALQGCLEVIKRDKPLLLVECANKEVADRGELFRFFSEQVGLESQVRCPGSTEWMDLNQWVERCKHQFTELNRQLDNYFIRFL